MKRVHWMVSMVAVSLALGRCARGPVPATAIPTEILASPMTTNTPQALATATSPPGPTLTVQPPADLTWIETAPLAEVGYEIPLFIRHVESTAALLQWELVDPAEVELLIWERDNPNELRMESLAPATGHFVVSNLTPATDYQGVLLVEGGRPPLLGEAWPIVSFTTSSSEFSGLRIGVLGDSGFGEATTRQLAEVLAERDPDLVLHTGDLVYRVEESPNPAAAFAHKLFQTHLPLLTSAPFYPVAGNHEFDFAARQDGKPYYQHVFLPLGAGSLQFPETSDGLYYSFVVEDVQFLMLNSQALFGIPGRSEQERWLEERVSDRRYRTTVVVLHVPPFNAGRHQTDSRTVKSAWGSLLGAAEVGLVLSGHDHNYQRHRVGGKTYVVSGGGSNSLYSVQADATGVEAAFRIAHVVVLEIDDAGFRITALDKNGQQLDDAEVPIP